MLIRPLLLALALSLISVPAGARPHEATLGVERAVAEHVAWVFSLFEDGADGMTASDIEDRFDENFLELVPPEEVVAELTRYAGEFGPLELVDELPADDNEHVALYHAKSGDAVTIGLAVDPDTGRIAGFFIIGAPLSRGSATPAS